MDPLVWPSARLAWLAASPSRIALSTAFVCSFSSFPVALAPLLAEGVRTPQHPALLMVVDKGGT
jgi:hypothetical protein